MLRAQLSGRELSTRTKRKPVWLRVKEAAMLGR